MSPLPYENNIKFLCIENSMAVTATCQAVKRNLDFSEGEPLGMPCIGKAEQQSHYACN